MNDYNLWLKEMNFSEDKVQCMMAELDPFLLNVKSNLYIKNKSKIHGIGLFAKKNINKKDFIGFALFKGKKTTLGRYTNHSKNPNIEFIMLEKNIVSYALSEIKNNEELLVNYRHEKLS